MKIIKVIDDEHIEISRYISPEARFFNPCIDIHNDYDKLESYCDFKETINPFQMYAENERLNNIINELLKKIQFYKTTEWGLRGYGILEDFENILNGGDVKSDR